MARKLIILLLIVIGSLLGVYVGIRVGQKDTAAAYVITRHGKVITLPSGTKVVKLKGRVVTLNGKRIHLPAQTVNFTSTDVAPGIPVPGQTVTKMVTVPTTVVVPGGTSTVFQTETEYTTIYTSVGGTSSDPTS